jgi:hypothetical protein
MKVLPVFKELCQYYQAASWYNDWNFFRSVFRQTG